MSLNTETETGQIAALALAGAKTVQIIEGPRGLTFAAVPDGVKLQDITPENAAKSEKPDVIRQGVALQNATSLGVYVNRFKTPNTILFADIDKDTITAAIDYHGQTEADHVAHKATLTLPRSLEWKTWEAIDGRLLSQLDFARFLEEHASDIADPDGSTLLETVNNIQAIENVDFRAKVRTNSDNIDFDLKASSDAVAVQGNERLSLPKVFTLRIPVYFDGQDIDLEARLRWKKSQAEGLQLGVMLLRKEQERQAEFRRIVDEVGVATNLTTIYGHLDH